MYIQYMYMCMYTSKVSVLQFFTFVKYDFSFFFHSFIHSVHFVSLLCCASVSRPSDGVKARGRRENMRRFGCGCGFDSLA